MIPVRKLLGIILVLLAVTAGCVRSNSEGEEMQFETADRTSGFNQITYSSGDISPGRRIEVRAVIQNNNVVPAENVELEIMNIAPLQLEGESQGPFTESQGVRTCSFESLGPASETSGGDIRSCRWTLTCPENSQCSRTAENFESYDVPIRIGLSYETEITNPEDSIEVEFLSLEDMTGRQTSEKTYMAENGDLRLEAVYESPEPVDEDSLEIEMSLTDTGEGNLDSQGINIEYVGPFSNYLEDQSSCDTLIIPEGESSVSNSCLMALKDIEAGNIYQMRLRGRYKYSKTENIQLKITS